MSESYIVLSSLLTSAIAATWSKSPLPHSSVIDVAKKNIRKALFAILILFIIIDFVLYAQIVRLASKTYQPLILLLDSFIAVNALPHHRLSV